MGLHLESVQRDRCPELLSALHKAGFELASLKATGVEDQDYRCRRGDRDVFLGVSPGREEHPDEVWVVTAIPPYSPWPWRWRDDRRFFGAVTGVLDGFHYLDLMPQPSPRQPLPR